jgi:hypothetical protein
MARLSRRFMLYWSGMGLDLKSCKKFVSRVTSFLFLLLIYLFLPLPLRSYLTQFSSTPMSRFSMSTK